jgi:MFS family permease
VSVVSSVGYAAFLVGPPFVGFLGDQFGIRHALYVVLAALALAFVTSGRARPLPR